MLPKGSKIGILGGGQLAQMLASAARGLDYECYIYTDNKDSCCTGVVESTLGSFHNVEKLRKFIDSVDVVTYETENLDLYKLDRYDKIKPSIVALGHTQNRAYENALLYSMGIKKAEHTGVICMSNITKTLNEFGFPLIIKSCRGGYDGKNQWLCRSPEDVDKFIETDGYGVFDKIHPFQFIAERVLDFKQEISAIAVRDEHGNFGFYDTVATFHENGILRRAEIPADISPVVDIQAKDIVERIANRLQYVGVLCVEFFLMENDDLYVNEIAPRVHNSGHWTVEASRTSQFENHIRAICGMELGDTWTTSKAELINLLTLDDLGEKLDMGYLNSKDYIVTLYGKKAPKKGVRKLGHITKLIRD